MSESKPVIACTLDAARRKDRVASNVALAAESLISAVRRGSTIQLTYRRDAEDAVRTMVAAESICCAFLTFELKPGVDAIHLSITVPEHAADLADDVFAQFVPHVATSPCQAPSCCVSDGGCEHEHVGVEPRSADPVGNSSPPTLANLAAVTAATGAVACGVCCALPFAWPALMALGAGGAVGWFGSTRAEVTVLAMTTTVAAWIWLFWRSSRSRMRISRTNLLAMSVVTLAVLIAVAWPRVEPGLTRFVK